ncbi:MAG: carbohydrate-binding family 9-like protein [Clostridium sp.]|jgi:hypothetical protein|nr:carbohydrate-binding family 9-like protein [Clostridium sp.]
MKPYRIPVPQVGFCPPLYVCRYTDKPFVLDGRLDKDFWADAEFTDFFADIEGDIRPAPRFRTRAKLLWDDRNLYIGAQLSGTEIWASITERDAVIFRDNDFEIFLDPDSDSQQYYELEMNALNTVWDLFLTKAYRDGGLPLDGFDFRGLRTAVFLDGALNDPAAENRLWSVEVVIPFLSIGECARKKRIPADGEYYRMNFSRVQWKVDVADGGYRKRLDQDTGLPLPEDNWVWASTGVVDIHYPELWAFVFFAGKEGGRSGQAYGIPEEERIKWELRKLYYAQHAYYDETGVFCKDLEQLTEVLRRISPIEENAQVRPLPYRLEAAPHSFEISCPCADGSRTLVIFQDGKTVSV